MKIWFDTEFYEDGEVINLISLGAVREDGKTFYAESYDAVELCHNSGWLEEHVLPHLNGNIGMRPLVMGNNFYEFAGKDPEFWAYYGAYDWVSLCQIYGKMIQLPKGWPMYCRDVKQWCDDLGNPKLPKQTTPEHHALNDALWTRQAWEFLRDRKRNSDIREGRMLPPGVHQS